MFKLSRARSFMNVLIIGSGGREHALAWKASQSAQVDKVFVAPGNAGTAQEANIENIDIDVMDTGALVSFGHEHQVDLTIVGPEAPLSAGIVDAFIANGLPCFGPSRQAAQLEASKSFCKDFFKRHHIPTAAYQTFTEVDPAKDYVRKQGTPIVIKASGLASGKGVVIAQSEGDAFQTIEEMLGGYSFGEAGHEIVIEEFLEGEEASFIVMTDGEHILPLATSQDHKARDNGDKGPNTGGMGAYSPAPVITNELHTRVLREIIEPTVRGMREDARTYTGFLYAGLMITPDGNIKVLEFNCRFGDPETQPIMMRMQSDLIELIQLALMKQLNTAKAKWDPRAALGVVLAAGGYPFKYRKGDIIHGLPADKPDLKIFHAGTRAENSNILTNGGRVLCVTALAEDIAKAKEKAYNAAAKIQFDDSYYRTDIGYRAVANVLS